MEWELCTI